MTFADDFAAANDLLAEAFGEEVTLVRGASTASAVTAQVQMREYAGEDDEGIATLFQSVDFVVSMDDYDFGSGAVQPRGGDRIKRTINSVVHTYEVMQAPNGRASEWADTSGDEWLIHTKHVDP